MELVNIPSSERPHGVGCVFFVEMEIFEKTQLSICWSLVYPVEMKVPRECGRARSWNCELSTLITEGVAQWLFNDDGDKDSADSDRSNVGEILYDGGMWISDSETLADDADMTVGAFSEHHTTALMIVTLKWSPFRAGDEPTC